MQRIHCTDTLYLYVACWRKDCINVNRKKYTQIQRHLNVTLICLCTYVQRDIHVHTYKREWKNLICDATKYALQNIYVLKHQHIDGLCMKARILPYLKLANINNKKQ